MSKSHRSKTFRGARARLLGALAIPLLALASGACNFLMDLSTSQCESNEDCSGFGGDLVCANQSCTPRAVLSQAPPPDASAEGDSPAHPTCKSSAECVDGHLGEPYRCVEGQCVALKSGVACPFVVQSEEVRNDNAIVLGAFLPLGGAAPLAQPLALTYQLALREINNAGGLPGGSGSPRRPVVVVFCDSDPATAEQGVKHLTQTVQVPAAVALFSQTDTTRFFQDYFLPKGIFMLNPQDTTEALKRVDGQRLMWHLLGTPEDVARAYRPLVARTEAYVRNRIALPPSSPVRLAIVTSESPTEESMLSVIRDPSGSGIVLNAVAVVPGDPNLLSIKVPSLEKDPTATFSSFVQQVVDFRPNIVIMLTSDVELKHFVPALDTLLAETEDPSRLPAYVLGPRNSSSSALTDYLASGAVEAPEAKRRRFVGMQYASAVDETASLQFRARYAEAYPQVDQRGALSVDNNYDAFYWLTYGFFAAGPGAPLKGSSFAEGVRKLLSGPALHAGTVKSISDSFVTLATATSGATFEGNLGTPDFDVASGAQRSVGSAYCYVRDGASGVVSPKFDTLRYDRTDGTLKGDTFCFVGF